MSDLIKTQAAIDALDRIFDRCEEIEAHLPEGDPDRTGYKMYPDYMTVWKYLHQLPSAQPEQQWIPFKTRPLTEEEKEEYPEWDCILDCKLPDDGQAILVSINLRGHERVQYDEFYTDDGSYLDSGYAIGAEATAWMPLPDPWKGEEHETD